MMAKSFIAYREREIKRREKDSVMNDIVKTGTFDFNDILVRTIIEQSGEVLFRASDVAGALGLETHVMLRMVEDDDRTFDTVLTSGGSQQAAFLREAGLYTVMIRSNRPEAVPFRRWVTREVLPQIRKTGSFGAVENERLARLEGEVAAMKFILAGKQKKIPPQQAEPEAAGFKNFSRIEHRTLLHMQKLYARGKKDISSRDLTRISRAYQSIKKQKMHKVFLKKCAAKGYIEIKELLDWRIRFVITKAILEVASSD